MTYPYPIPGGTTTPAFTGPYFQVGNECCGGGMTNDIDAKTKVMLDYTNELPSGVNVSSVAYTLRPAIDEMLLISNQTTGNSPTFMVSGGDVGVTFTIEALATLSDGQIWVDHITVTVTDCGANISSSGGGSTLLSTLGPIIVSNTLYYYATAGQTVFSLDVPDEFGHIGTLSDASVLVYSTGDRRIPADNFTVSVGGNKVVFINPLAAGTSVVFDLLHPPPPAPVIPPPVVITGGLIVASLYYAGVGGQTVFSLGMPDLFGHVATLTTSGALVSRNGMRLIPDDSFAFDVANNQIVFAYPVGDGESVIFDLVTMG